MVTTAAQSRRTAMENVIETAAKPAAGAQPAAKQRKPAKRSKPAKKSKAKKSKPTAKKGGKPVAERTNKKAEVIAMMKRTKGATLAEIVEATGWQKHTVRGFVSILGKKGGEKIESSKNAAGTGSTKSPSKLGSNRSSKRRRRFTSRGWRSCFWAILRATK